MNLLENTIKLLEMNPNPSFIVEDGKIICANSAALQHFITVGSDIQPLLLTGAEEYKSFTGDCLCLRLNIEHTTYDAFVQVYDQMHLFVLDAPNNSPELRAMALVAQELRLPLSGMLNLTDELFPTILGNVPETTAKLSALNKNLYQLLRIVGNMSDAYHYSNMTAPIFEVVNINTFMLEHFEKIKTLLEQTTIHFEYESLPCDILVPINTEILSKAVYNLFSNAIKFTPENGHITAKLTADRKRLSFTISNTGTTSSQIRASAFQRFSRQPGIEDGRYGIGLGMEVVRAAASIHDGTILMHQDEDLTAMTMTISLRDDNCCKVRTNVLRIDSLGGMDLGLIQLSDALPAQIYIPE